VVQGFALRDVDLRRVNRSAREAGPQSVKVREGWYKIEHVTPRHQAVRKLAYQQDESFRAARPDFQNRKMSTLTSRQSTDRTLLVPGHPLQIKWIRRKELNILERTAIAILITRLLARFPNAQISDPNFIPAYGGAVGELRLQSLPMQIH
jgi:hypothetical protein